MPARAVFNAVTTYLAAGWSATPIIAYDTLADVSTMDDAFLVVQFPVVNGIKPVLGRRYFEEGTIRLVLNVRRGIGPEQGLDWSDNLRLMFRDVKFGGGLETFTPDGPPIDDNIEEGDWISYSIIVPYRYQYDSGELVTGAGALSAQSSTAG